MIRSEERHSATAGSAGGRLVVIVGPSGSGKDTLIAWLRHRLGDRRDVQFVRRIVTRKVDADLEDHDTMSRDEFADADASGRFAVTWPAHGLYYALPVSALDHVRRGGIAIANGSRQAIDDIESTFGNVLVVHLSVDPDVLRGRLRERGRESPAEIEWRLRRAAIAADKRSYGHVIDNSGPIDDAGTRVLQLIELI